MGEHADAHEYLYGLLSAMSGSSKGMQPAKQPTSLIQAVFSGEHLSEVRC